MKKNLSILLILCAVGVIRQDFGPLSFELGRLLAIILMAAYVLFLLPLSEACIFLLPGIVVGCLLALRQDQLFLQLSGVSLILFAVSLYARWCRKPHESIDIGMLMVAFCACFSFLYEYNTACWYAVEYISQLFSSVCSFVYRRQLDLGPSCYGFFIIVPFTMLHTLTYCLDRRRSTLRLAAALGYTLLAGVGYVGFHVLAASIINRCGIIINRSDLHTQAALFIFLSISIILQRPKHLSESPLLPATWAWPLAGACCLAVGVMVSVLLCNGLPERKPFEKRVVFYTKGSLDWDVPRFGTYGQRSGGMFGLMPKHLSAVGFRTGMIDSIAPAYLAEADCLVMINLDQPLSRQELLTVWDFVRHGGGLLLLGDHTNLGGLMDHFNQILLQVPMRFQFDSAMPSRYTWDYLMDVRAHVLTRGLSEQIAGAWWVGASLKCLPPAVPLVVGRYCYADKGYAHNISQAYLGNRRFDYYERQNDVVLAACVRYGNGIIMACGDTSAFHNTTSMATWPFVANVCNVLAERSGGNAGQGRMALIAAVAICLILILVLTFIPRLNIVTPAVLLVALAITAHHSASLQVRGHVSSIPDGRLGIAYIDYAHVGRFDQMSWEDDSIGGLKNNLLRNGFFPMALKRWDREAIMSAKILILIAPTRRFASGEIAILKEFVAQGGRLLLSVGWEERDASLPVLDAFNFGIDSVPLAQATCEYHDREKMLVHFHEAWPVLYEDGDDITVLCRPLGFAAVVVRRFGAGRIAVIGDSYFLLNETLEGSKNYSIPNMMLLRNLLTG